MQEAPLLNRDDEQEVLRPQKADEDSKSAQMPRIERELRVKTRVEICDVVEDALLCGKGSGLTMRRGDLYGECFGGGSLYGESSSAGKV